MPASASVCSYESYSERTEVGEMRHTLLYFNMSPSVFSYELFMTFIFANIIGLLYINSKKVGIFYRILEQ